MLYNVYMWSGGGYQLDKIQVDADWAEQALERAIVEAERGRQYLFFDDCNDLEQMERAGLVLYVDATMEGAERPHYIDAQNLKIEAVKK